MCCLFFFEGSAYHRDLHVLTHAFPTRRASDLARQDSFNLGVEWFQLDEDGMQVLMPGWNLHTGPLYPNRLVLPVKNPLYLYFVEPQFQDDGRSEEHTSELQSLMRISSAVFCLKKKRTTQYSNTIEHTAR